MIQLQILSGNKAGQECQARRFPFLLGRAQECHWISEDPGVWDRHLTITLNHEGQFEATIQEGAFGALNDEPFRSSPLRNGDILHLGSLKLMFAMGPTQSRSLVLREWLVWLGLAGLFASQLALIYFLPG